MVPTKATAVAASRLIRSSAPKRSRPTSMPSVSARSSPRRSAVIGQAARRLKGSTSSTTIVSVCTAGQLERVRLPRLQNTSCCRASAEARYCSSATSAL